MAMPAMRRKTEPRLARAHGHGRILLLDDSAASRRRKTELLSRHGYEVTSISTEEEAYTLCRKHDFGLILVDHRKDPQRAADFCQRIREERPHQMIGLLLDPDGALPLTKSPNLIWPDEDDDHFLARVETLAAFSAAA